MKNPSQRTAFSLIEISIVILIVSLAIAGIGQGLDLLDNYRVTVARKLTKTSKVASTPGIVVWYEPTLEDSFSKSNRVDGVTVSQWNDTNPQSNVKINAYAAQKTNSALVSYDIASGSTSSNTSGPTYISKGINSLPTLRFTNNNSSAYRALYVDKQMKNGGVDNLTLFVVMRYRSGSGFFIDRSCV